MATSLSSRDVDLVDQAQLVDVDRDFRVEHRLQLLDQLVGQLVEFGLADLSAREQRLVGHDQLNWKKARALASALTNASASSRVLYRAKEARALDVTPNLFIRGSAQWVAGADGHAVAVQHLGHVVGVGALDHEAKHRALARAPCPGSARR